MNATGIILAGGKGTRMDYLTKTNHKCLLKVGNFPILTHILFQFHLIGVNKIIVCTGFLSNKIKEYVENNLYKDLFKLSKILNKKINTFSKITISKSNISDSTSQRLFKIKKIIGNNDFLICYGDSLVDLNYRMYNNFVKKNNFCDIILSVSNPKERFGVVNLKKNKVIGFSEKRYNKSRWVNSGWIHIKNRTLKNIKNVDDNFENYLFKKNLKIMAFKNYFYYLPIDNINDLKNANLDWIKNNKTWFSFL